MDDNEKRYGAEEFADEKPQAVQPADTVPPPEATFRVVGNAGLLFGALAMAQGQFQPITKNRTVTVRPREGQPYTFDYATLDQVLAATVPALSANGLCILQPFYHGPNGLELRTILAHSSGARLEAVTELPKLEGKLQAAGSALTYLKRYQVQAILGVSSEEDDDGNSADGNQVQNSQPRDRSRPAPPPGRQEKPREAKRPPPLPPEAKPEPAPAKPSEPPAAQTEAPPAGTTGPITAEQKKGFSVLFREVAGFNGPKAKEFLRLLVGRDDGLSERDGVHILATLELAKKMSYTADQLIEFIRNKGDGVDPFVVISDLEAESEAFFGGAS